MKKLISILMSSALLLSACGQPSFEPTNQVWEEFPPEEGSVRPIVRLNSVLDENLFFKIKYDPEKWEVKDSKGKFRTNLILSHKNYTGDSCALLPGTIGYELEKEFIVEQWQYRSDITWGTDYEFINPITQISERRVFEAESNGAGFPSTLFELHLPQDGQEQFECVSDWNQVIGTYQFESYEGTPEELEAILNDIKAQEALNAELEQQKEIQKLLEGLEEESTEEEV